MSKKLRSVFTDDMNRCYFTGRYDHVERHHILGGFNRSASEKYGFVIPLHASIHPNGAYCMMAPEERVAFDLKLKRMAQTYFEEKIGTREEFMEVFGRNYL